MFGTDSIFDSIFIEEVEVRIGYELAFLEAELPGDPFDRPWLPLDLRVDAYGSLIEGDHGMPQAEYRAMLLISKAASESEKIKNS